MASTKSNRIAKGDNLLKEGKKCLETGLFKWKPDHERAVIKFEDAAKEYRIGGDIDKQIEALRLASSSHEKMNSYHLAAKTLSEAAMVMERNQKDLVIAANYLIESAGYHLANSHPDKSIECYLKAGKLYCEVEDKENALSSFNAAFDAIESEGRAKLGHENFKKIQSYLMRKQMYEEALHFYQRQVTILVEEGFEHPEPIYKAMTAIIILLLHLHKYNEADAELQKFSSIGEYATTQYFDAVHRIISALSENASEKFQEAVNNRDLTYLDNQISLVAKKLKYNENQLQSLNNVANTVQDIDDDFT